MAGRPRSKRGGRVEAEPDPPRRIDWQRARELRNRGLSNAEISRELGFTKGSIARCLERHGVQRRKRISTDPRARKPELRALRAAWEKMRRRCDDPSYPPYPLHGARGVRVCKEWQSFNAFSGWALENGYQLGYWLVRVAVRGSYSPSNCRWVSRTEGQGFAMQGHAPRTPGWTITAFGTTKSAAAWSRDDRCVVSLTSLIKRLRRGLDPERAITDPPSSGGVPFVREIRAFGQVKTLREWVHDSRCTGSASSLLERLDRGWSAEDAISQPRFAPAHE